MFLMLASNTDGQTTVNSTVRGQGSTQMSRIGHLTHSVGVCVLRSPIVRYLQGADG